MKSFTSVIICLNYTICIDRDRVLTAEANQLTYNEEIRRSFISATDSIYVCGWLHVALLTQRNFRIESAIADSSNLEQAAPKSQTSRMLKVTGATVKRIYGFYSYIYKWTVDRSFVIDYIIL